MARPVFPPRVPEGVKAAGARLRALVKAAAARLGPPLVRYGPLALLWLAGAGLIVSEFLTYREIVAVTVVPEGGRTTGGAHHGYALVLIGLVSLPMSYGAVIGRSRPAAAAVAALGAITLVIAALFDIPSLDDTGLIGRTYDLAEARPGAGFWLEIACAVVLLLGGLLMVRRGVVAAREASDSRREERRARRAADAEAPPPDDDPDPDPDPSADPDPAPAPGAHAAGSRRASRRG